jgi:hypothetical protein
MKHSNLILLSESERKSLCYFFAKIRDSFQYRDWYSSDEDSWNAQILLEQYLDIWNITVRQMKEALAQQVMELFGISVEFHFVENGTIRVRSIENLQISFTNWCYLCYDIDFPSANVTLKSTFDAVYIEMNPKESLT